MLDALGHHYALPRVQRDGPVLEVDQELAGHAVEELVIVVVLVPVVFTLHDTEPHDRLVHLAEGLVVPRELAVIDQLADVDELERIVEDVEARLVWIRGR